MCKTMLIWLILQERQDTKYHTRPKYVRTSMVFIELLPNIFTKHKWSHNTVKQSAMTWKVKYSSYSQTETWIKSYIEIQWQSDYTQFIVSINTTRTPPEIGLEFYTSQIQVFQIKNKPEYFYLIKLWENRPSAPAPIYQCQEGPVCCTSPCSVGEVWHWD